MKYYITTLAINEPYFTKSIEFHKKLSEKTEHAFLNITTTKNDIKNFEEKNNTTIENYLSKYPKVKITTIDKFNKRFTFPLAKEQPVDFAFNLNLKVLSLKACIESENNFDYVFFMDGDWSMHDLFEEEKLINALKLMEGGEFDFAFERPALVGPYKTNPECFFPQKIKDYKVLEHELWDDAHVVNEQFLIFCNNWKFRMFTMKWEQLLWYSIANDFMNYPDGFEIGVAALESKMKYTFYGIFSAMTGCFNFYSKDGGFNIRF